MDTVWVLGDAVQGNWVQVPVDDWRHEDPVTGQRYFAPGRAPGAPPTAEWLAEAAGIIATVAPRWEAAVGPRILSPYLGDGQFGECLPHSRLILVALDGNPNPRETLWHEVHHAAWDDLPGDVQALLGDYGQKLKAEAEAHGLGEGTAEEWACRAFSWWAGGWRKLAPVLVSHMGIPINVATVWESLRRGDYATA